MNRYFIAIDPGRCTGFAVFGFFQSEGWRLLDLGTLQSAATGVSALTTDLRNQFVARVWTPLHARGVNLSIDSVDSAAEYMEWHPSAEKSNPTDLIQVATIAGVLAGVVGREVRFIPPSLWKGNVPKSVMHERQRRVLKPSELSLVNTVGRMSGESFHNAMDALGIGLFALGRMRRGGA